MENSREMLLSGSAMIYVFDDFELDTAKVELRRNGAAIAVEPQVFALLRFLVENRDRVVTKEEIVERIWDGRIVSDSAIASRIKSARQALGDDGTRAARHTHRPWRRLPLRWRCSVGDRAGSNMAAARAQTAAEMDLSDACRAARPSIAVLPFRLVGAAGPQSAIADALPQDLITELSRLRWLFVIASASSFRFRSEDMRYRTRPDAS